MVLGDEHAKITTLFAQHNDPNRNIRDADRPGARAIPDAEDRQSTR